MEVSQEAARQWFESSTGKCLGNKVEKILAIKQLCQKQDLQLSDLNIVVAHSKWMEFGDRKEKLHMVKVIKCDCANEYFYVWAEKTDLQDGQK